MHVYYALIYEDQWIQNCIKYKYIINVLIVTPVIYKKSYEELFQIIKKV